MMIKTRVLAAAMACLPAFALAQSVRVFDYIHITDSLDDAVNFIVAHPPVA
ncbi:MAG: hypothetical protein HYX47_01955 [Burkholderiales bacterium]|nr:hypothetical protein [Burkholderiales bacterium]